MPALPAHAIDARVGRRSGERGYADRSGAGSAGTGAAATVCAHRGQNPFSMVRSTIYFAAVCRCFPGKTPTGGDRVPARDEIHNCSSWMDDEIKLLRPRLIIPVGRLAIAQFINCEKLEKVVGRSLRITRAQHRFDLIPLPHPSGASPWHKIPPGKELLELALKLIAGHPAIKELAQRPP